MSDGWKQEDIWTPQERRIQVELIRHIRELDARTADPEVHSYKKAQAESAAAEAVKLFRRLFPGLDISTQISGADWLPPPDRYDTHGKDTQTHVYFYPSEFYCLSSFSPDRVGIWGLDFDTAEHAYHWVKFAGKGELQYMVRTARSAHMAFRLAQEHKGSERAGWMDQREDFMLDIITAKYSQHEYVRRLLARTGDRIVVEDSWRCSYWGTGPDGRGLNRLGALWMKLRDTKLGTGGS